MLMKDKITVSEVTMLVNAGIIFKEEARDLLRQLEILPEVQSKKYTGDGSGNSTRGSIGGQGGGSGSYGGQSGPTSRGIEPGQKSKRFIPEDSDSLATIP